MALESMASKSSLLEDMWACLSAQALEERMSISLVSLLCCSFQVVN